MPLSVFAAAAEAPDRTALVTDDVSLSYAELAGRVRKAVGWLRRRSLDGDAPVALVATNDIRTLEMLHALVAVGTPALLVHPRSTAAERAAAVEAVAGARLVPGDWHAAAGDLGDGSLPAEPRLDGERPLAIVQTSGTSGRPRGVVLSRRAFAASAAASAANLGWRDDDRWLLPLPVAHVGGLSIVTRCLLARRAVVLTDDAKPASLLDAIRRHRVTLLSLVPTVLARILELHPAAAPPDPLRAVLLGGAAASPALLERAADAGWPVLTTYGLTEACSQVTTQRYGTVNRGDLGSGAPLPGIELRIGQDDEIQVRGPTLFSRYVPTGGDPEPFLAQGWFATGDRGRIDEAGNLHVLGRRADRIVTGGENVDPVEVERALERLPGISQACVFGVPDEEWGEVVCAAVVVAGEGGAGRGRSASLDAETGETGETAETGETWEWRQVAAVVRGLDERLASFKLPRRVAVVESLPTNATGKVDRRETARRATGRLREVRGSG